MMNEVVLGGGGGVNPNSIRIGGGISDATNKL